MKNLFIIITLGLFFSCSRSQNAEGITDGTLKTPETTLQKSDNDSILYLNKVGYFTETNEFYVSLSFNKPISEEYFNILSSKADSVVFEDDGLSRFRLPMATAKEAFDFRNLEEVKIYDNQHHFITYAKLTRTEYVVDVNGYFVAVFKPEKEVPKDANDFYCLGTAKVRLKDIAIQTIEGDELTERIKKELDIEPEYIWNVEHVNVQPYGSTYSLLAYLKDNGETVTYLTELKDDKIRILYTLKEEYAFYGVLPVPVEIKGKPVLLLHLVLPDSDAVDDYVVATYNGTGYKLSEDNRIKIE